MSTILHRSSKDLGELFYGPRIVAHCLPDIFIVLIGCSKDFEDVHISTPRVMGLRLRQRFSNRPFVAGAPSNRIHRMVLQMRLY